MCIGCSPVLWVGSVWWMKPQSIGCGQHVLDRGSILGKGRVYWVGAVCIGEGQIVLGGSRVYWVGAECIR